jgi:hypothetical protein
MPTERAHKTNVEPTAGSHKTDAEVTFLAPLKPRRGLFYLCLGLVLAWCLVLVGMFLTTVYPHPEIDPHRRVAATRGA